MLGNNVLYANLTGKHKEGNFFFPECSISIFQGSVYIS